MEPIIESILDDDLYKFSMQQAIFHQYPNAEVAYEFKCRNEDVKLGFLADDVQAEVEALGKLEVEDAEVSYLKSLGFFKNDYLQYLLRYRYNPEQVVIRNWKDQLEVDIEGPWLETILWEVKLLAIINELYFRETSDFRSVEGEGNRRLRDKINLIRPFLTLLFAEFGTRRRRSREWQEHVVTEMHQNLPQMIGTSNVHLAHLLMLKPIGTQAHEWFSAHLALVDNLREAQKRALYVWLQEYGTDLGIALTDTFTSDAFFEDFNIVLAREFAGVRHDSGDPVRFGERVINHYQKFGIDPRTKSLIFSDGLDIPKAIDLYKRFVGRIGVSFGIGTNLTNDLGPTPLNIVIKLIQCNGIPVVKLSDNPTKAIGDPAMIKNVKEEYGVSQ